MKHDQAYAAIKTVEEYGFKVLNYGLMNMKQEEVDALINTLMSDSYSVAYNWIDEERYLRINWEHR